MKLGLSCVALVAGSAALLPLAAPASTTLITPYREIQVTANLRDPLFQKTLLREHLYLKEFEKICIDPSGVVSDQDVTPGELGMDVISETFNCRKAFKEYYTGPFATTNYLLNYAESTAPDYQAYFSGRKPVADDRFSGYRDLRTVADALSEASGVLAIEARMEGRDCLDLGTEAAPVAARSAALPFTAWLKKFHAIVNSATGCAEKQTALRQLRSAAPPSDSFERSLRGWVEKNLRYWIERPGARIALGGAVQLSNMVVRGANGDNDAYVSNSFSIDPLRDRAPDEQSVVLRLALLSSFKSPLEAAGIEASYDRVMRDGEFRNTIAMNVQNTCDKHLTELFAGPEDAASGSGVDRVSGNNGVVVTPDFRFHTFANLHVYDFAKHHPIFAPAGPPQAPRFSGPTGGTDENACYGVFYPIGVASYRGPINLVICHLAAPAGITGEKNALGSTRVGGIGGPGGSGGGSYSHSHLYLVAAGGRRSFVDVFCR